MSVSSEFVMPVPRRRPSVIHCEAIAKLAEQPQGDFEFVFFSRLLNRLPDYIDAMRVHAENLHQKGASREALVLLRKAVAIRPEDGRTHVDLAGQYAALAQPDLALAELQAAVGRGYKNWHYLRNDRKFDPLRDDPRFQALLPTTTTPPT
jgi:tetratricopeptide (TPR) repeat protein